MEAEVRSKRRWYEEEQWQYEEEQQQCEEAEALAANSESSTLPFFLHVCYELLVVIEIVTDSTWTTQEMIMRLTNWRVSSCIILWDTFTEK